ncbi:hypothetical protein CMV_024021 [Castanea mollissima]|uniref:Bulb-type lectin domain-containing protein n=1 Tax=Castanea mollissima TaxID=60419 RepID=A0A8J4QNR0_9ROSI|nr:hypothetical protein CMV_024021 [Castanea mollissima]
MKRAQNLLIQLMHDSGNFVLYNNSSHVIWQSFDNPTDTILGGQNLSNGDELVSRSDHSSRRYCLKMKTNGNLVSSPVNSTDGSENAYWHQVHRYRELSPENVNVEFAENFSLHSFSYNELENATDGFKENGFKEVLGEGSFGSVYKGYVSEANKTLVVKRLEKLLDKLVEDENVDMKTLERMVKVGLWCIQEDPALRPPMKNVILMLEGTVDIAVPPSPAISHS